MRFNNFKGHPQVLENLAKISLSRAKRALSDLLPHSETIKLWELARELYPDTPKIGKLEPFNILKIRK